MDESGIIDGVISSPLCIAARKGKSDVIHELLRKGHNVNINDNRGWTALHEAVAQGHLNCAELLLQHEESNVNACTFEGMSAMFVACEYQTNVNLIKLLVEHGVSCNTGNADNVTPLHIACKLHKLELVKELVKQGAHVNAQDFNNYTPIMEAIDQITNTRISKQESSLEIICFLLDNGTSMSLTDLYGRTTLFIAVCVKWKECVQLLLEYGSDVNARTYDGSTALLVAAQSGNLQIVKILLSHGAATNVICDGGTVPLHHALHNGYVSVAEELIKTTNFKDLIANEKRKLESFLILAIDSGSFETFKFVMSTKMYSHKDSASFSASDSTTLLNKTCFRHYIYQTPLSFLFSQHIEQLHFMPMVKYLLETGDFSVNALSHDFLPPLVALIAAHISGSNNIHVCKVQHECFLNLLNKGADIDYSSVKNCPGNFQIPDAVTAVVTPEECNVQHSLLLPVLAHSFSCDWDDLLDWLVKYNTCSAAVLNVLIRLSTKSKQSLLQSWDSVRQCSCHVCNKEFPIIQRFVCERDCTLQSLCRAKVRNWLWQITGKSSAAEKFLHQLHIPVLVKQYIVPEKV